MVRKRISLFAILAIICLACWGCPRNRDYFEIEHVQTFSGSGGGDGSFNRPCGVEQYGKYIAVADRANDRVVLFYHSIGSGWTFFRSITSTGSGDSAISDPIDIAFDPDGDYSEAGLNGAVYILCYVPKRIVKYNLAGQFLTSWARDGTADTTGWLPRSIATDSYSNVYVSDMQGNSIHKYSSQGSLITKWGSLGSGSGQFNGPIGVGIDNPQSYRPSINFVGVADSGNSRVQLFNLDGNFVKSFDLTGYSSILPITNYSRFDVQNGVISSTKCSFIGFLDNSVLQMNGNKACYVDKYRLISPSGISVYGLEVAVSDSTLNVVRLYEF